jgi:uncharacterized repeat protein (TIGR04138 family)
VKVAFLEEKGQVHLCYQHAAEEDLLDAPLDEIRAISEVVGYPVNAIIFIFEAVVRAEHLSDVSDISWAVIGSAKERFDRSARYVLRNWGITNRVDIGKIFLSVVNARLLPAAPSIVLEDFDVPFTLGDVLDPAF